MFSPTVRLFYQHDPQLRTETFSFSGLFKGPSLSGGPLISGYCYFRVSIGREKNNATFREGGEGGGVTFRILWYNKSETFRNVYSWAYTVKSRQSDIKLTI